MRHFNNAFHKCVSRSKDFSLMKSNVHIFKGVCSSILVEARDSISDFFDFSLSLFFFFSSPLLLLVLEVGRGGGRE